MIFSCMFTRLHFLSTLWKSVAQIFLLLLFHTFSRQPFLYIFIVSNFVLTLMIINLKEDSNLKISLCLILVCSPSVVWHWSCLFFFWLKKVFNRWWEKALKPDRHESELKLLPWVIGRLFWISQHKWKPSLIPGFGSWWPRQDQVITNENVNNSFVVWYENLW